MMANQGTLVLLRGPLLVAAVLLTLLIPAIQQLSLETAIRISILLFGCALFFRDVQAVIGEQIRSSFHKHLDQLVLDEWLRSIFDPVDGWIACFVATFLGNAAMYSLPTSEEQRTRLVQSALWIDEPKARSLLREPGGIKHLLPPSTQAWLEQRPQQETTMRFVDAECNSTASSESTDSKDRTPTKFEFSKSLMSEKLGVGREIQFSISPVYHEADGRSAAETQSNEGDKEVQDDRGSTTRQRGANCEPSQPSMLMDEPPLLYQVLGSIVQDMLSNKAKALLQSVPEGSLEITCLTATSALLLQLRYSRRAREILWNVLQGSTCLGLAAVLFGTVSALLAKSRVDTSSSNSLIAALVGKSGGIVTKLRELIQQGRLGRWKGWIAALVLLYFGRRKGQQREYAHW